MANTIKKCLQCGKEINLERNSRRLFCNNSCKSKYYYNHIEKFRERVKQNSMKYYLKKKDDPEYKRKAYERTKKWISENRERFNKLIREALARKKAKSMHK